MKVSHWSLRYLPFAVLKEEEDEWGYEVQLCLDPSNNCSKASPKPSQNSAESLAKIKSFFSGWITPPDQYMCSWSFPLLFGLRYFVFVTWRVAPLSLKVPSWILGLFTPFVNVTSIIPIPDDFTEDWQCQVEQPRKRWSLLEFLPYTICRTMPLCLTYSWAKRHWTVS